MDTPPPVAGGQGGVHAGLQSGLELSQEDLDDLLEDYG